MLLLLSVFLVPALAIIPVPGGLLATVFGQMDLDASGDLTKVEMMHYIQEFDLNKDGSVLEAEINAYIQIANPNNLEILYSFFNMDSMPGITLSDIDLIFKRYDINLDGKITLLEQVLHTKLGR